MTTFAQRIVTLQLFLVWYRWAAFYLSSVILYVYPLLLTNLVVTLYLLIVHHSNNKDYAYALLLAYTGVFSVIADLNVPDGYSIISISVQSIMWILLYLHNFDNADTKTVEDDTKVLLV